MTWIRNQKDIIELDPFTTDGVKYFVFQFVLGDDMVELYSSFLTELPQNVKTHVTKNFKIEIRANIRNYQNGHAHHLTVTSTFPYRAVEYKQGQAYSKKKFQEKYLQFMEVLMLIRKIYGDSYNANVLIQLMSSHCFIEEKDLPFTKDETCSGCGPGKTDPSTLKQNIISETKDNQINQTTASVETDNQISETTAKKVSQRNRKNVNELPGRLEQNIISEKQDNSNLEQNVIEETDNQIHKTTASVATRLLD